MLVGIVRCSTADQDPQMQRNALEAVGCTKLFEDITSGACSDRPGLTEALKFARSGDVLVSYSLSRVSRSLPELLRVMQDLESRGIGFRSITESIDTTTANGRLVFHLFAVLSEFERALLRERTIHGLAAARARGRVGGRRPVMTPAKIEAAKKLLATNTPVREIAKAIGVSTATFYRWLPAKANDEVPAGAVAAAQ